MFEPLSGSVGAVCLGYATIHAYARRGTAVSEEANAVRHAAVALVDDAERSESLFGNKAEALSALATLAEECSDPDWDGAGAEAIGLLALSQAKAFIRALPDDLPLPEFSVDPDGSVSMDWIDSKTRLFTLSIGENARLSYAWIDGVDRGHAVARFDGEEIPPRILDGIRSIVPHGASALWS